MPPSLPARALALPIFVAVCLAACRGGSGNAAANPQHGDHATSTSTVPAVRPQSTDKVTIQNFMFGPSAITVKAGTSVTWTNKDDEAHTVAFADSRSPVLVNGDNTYTKTFSRPSTYTYHCSIHPFMTGTVVVTP